MTTSGIIQAISGEEDQYFSVQQVTGLNLYEECETGLEYHRLYSLPKEIFEKILWLYTKRWAGEKMPSEHRFEIWENHKERTYLEQFKPAIRYQLFDYTTYHSHQEYGLYGVKDFTYNGQDIITLSSPDREYDSWMLDYGFKDIFRSYQLKKNRSKIHYYSNRNKIKSHVSK